VAVPVVVLVRTPATAPEAAALAGRLVALGHADAAVIAGLESEQAGHPFSKIAERTARKLSRDGVVVEIGRAAGDQSSATVRSRAGTAARTELVLETLSAAGAPMPRVEVAEGSGEAWDVRIALGGKDVDALFEVKKKGPAQSAEPTLSVASPVAAADVLDDLHAATSETSSEELLVLRRLLLEPLVGAPRARSLPFVRACAANLGYTLHGPTSLGATDDALVLLPTKGETGRGATRPLALVARASGVRKLVVEVPHGFADGLRDLGMRLGTTLGADAILVGLEHGGGARGMAAMRLAHAVATAKADGRTPSVLVVRGAANANESAAASVTAAPSAPGTAAAAPGVVALGTWGGPEKGPLRDAVAEAFVRIGLRTEDRPLDLAARELGGRAVFGETPLVAVAVDATALRTISLDDARSTARILLGAGVPAMLGSASAAATRLLASIPEGAEPPSQDVFDLARRTTLEHSVVARRALASVVSSNAARIALVRGEAGDALVVVTKTKSGVFAGTFSTDPRSARASLPVQMKRFAECAATLDNGGTCRAEEP
jgi:hypothetical protein